MLEYILFEIIREIDGTLRFTTQLITEYQKISGCFAIDRCQKRLNNNETLIFDTYKMTIPAQHSSFQPHLGSFDLDFKQLKLEQTIKFGTINNFAILAEQKSTIMKNNTPYNQEFFNNMAVKFDTHVKQSIPLFEMFQANVAANIERLFRDKKILDVCGSTGELGRKLLLNGWQGQYTCLDGSKEMQKVFDTVTPAGSKKSLGFAMAGFMGGWNDTFDGETYTVPPFLPSMPDYDVQEKPYDLAIEILGFQFFTPDRLEEIRTMKKLAKTCILFEKFSDQDDEVFGSNEVLKDQLYKSNFFTQSEIRAKRTNVLENMGDYCYDSREFSGILHREFAYVERIAKIGNFSGYLVSTDENMHKQWVANMRLNFNRFTDLKTF